MTSSQLSIKQIIESRDLRYKKQQELVNAYKNTLICFKLNIPGQKKDNSLYRNIFDVGFENLCRELESYNVSIIYFEKMYKTTGAEAFIIVNETGNRIKSITTTVEEKHSLGRIFDIDVINENFIQISRTEIGKAERKCYICGDSAFVCGRSRKHSVEELVNYIEEKSNDYFKNHG